MPNFFDNRLPSYDKIPEGIALQDLGLLLSKNECQLLFDNLTIIIIFFTLLASHSFLFTVP